MRITARDGAVPAASVIFLVMCSATFLAAAAVAVVAVLRVVPICATTWRCRLSKQ